MTTGTVIRIEEAGLGPGAQVRLVLSGVDRLQELHRPWASSGATLERAGGRIRATTTVEALARAAGRTFDKAQAAEIDAVLRSAVASWAGETPRVELPGEQELRCDERPLVMGVVNVTPDSFSDGGQLYPDGHPGRAIAHGRALIAQGADLLDVGGESSRPGAEPVHPAEERERVLPVIEALAPLGVPLSIDTTKAEVAAAAVDAGAVVVNDVSGARAEALLDVVARAGVAYVLMHTRGTPADMAEHAAYDDVVAEVHEFLAEGLMRCEHAGVPRERVLVDPGIGFAKTAVHNLELLRALRQLRSLGRPVAVGASRKSFLGAILGSNDPADRLEGSLACAALAAQAGAGVIRVHDVAATVRAVRTAHAIATARLPDDR